MLLGIVLLAVLGTLRFRRARVERPRAYYVWFSVQIQLGACYPRLSVCFFQHLKRANRLQATWNPSHLSITVLRGSAHLWSRVLCHHTVVGIIRYNASKIFDCDMNGASCEYSGFSREAYIF